MDYQEKINKLEQKWIKDLIHFNSMHFKQAVLFSHNESHHIRVWHICKELIRSVQNEINIESLFFAAFFHDSGLVLNNGFNHGKLSKQIFKAYCLQQRIVLSNMNLTESMIEFHDDKTYIKKTENLTESIEFKILCAADDLDAFGIIGIYRYLEIYLIRQIKSIEIPGLILENLNNRFQNFQFHFKQYTELYNKYEKKYLISLDFFRLLEEDFNRSQELNYSKGPLSVLNLIDTLIIKEKLSVFKLMQSVQTITNDSFTIDFFNKLNLELNYYEENTHF